MSGTTLSSRRDAVRASVRSSRRRRQGRRAAILTALAVGVVIVFAVSLMVGQRLSPPSEVLRVLLGEDVPGASFIVGELRLPRAVLGIAAGACFGLAGVTFQTMLRNPLASPDIIGISAGASAAATFGIVVLGLGGFALSLFAIVGGLSIALVVYLLSYRSGVSGTRLILIGIGVAAMLDSVTSFILDRAGQWDLQDAMRWLTGSLNGATWGDIRTVAIAVVLFAPVLLADDRALSTLQLGDDTAAALGTRVSRTRMIALVASVGLIAFATAATGPIAFVAFLAGPIAARLVGSGSLLVPAALTGSLLVALADFCGQVALASRYPVGVVTGVLGAPFLISLIIRSNRSGGGL